MTAQPNLEAVERLERSVASVDGQYGFEDDKLVDCRHFGAPYNDFVPLTWGDLRRIHSTLRSQAEALEKIAYQDGGIGTHRAIARAALTPEVKP